MLFTPAASDCCSFPFYFAFTVVPSAFSTLIFKHWSGRRAPSRYQGGRGSRGHARGYSAETRRYDGGRIGLGEGEEEGGGCSLKGSSVSGDVLVAVELVIHGKKKKKKKGLRWGYMPLFKPTHTHAWMGSAHLHILHEKHWGRIIRTLVAIHSLIPI